VAVEERDRGSAADWHLLALHPERAVHQRRPGRWAADHAYGKEKVYGSIP
jgi:hypothetical protein